MTKKISLYQITYSEETLHNLEPGYLILDYLDNERPDWREYWPIRRFLLNQALDNETFYGFFSPKFRYKTSLSFQQTIAHIESSVPETDIVLFSPQPDMGAFFLNVFEQVEPFHPGYIKALEGFLEYIGFKIDAKYLVMDSRHVVFSNYFAAKPVFWRHWLELNEKLFELCEGIDSPLKRALTDPTSYREGVQHKVFIMERIASLLLMMNPEYHVKSVNPFSFGWSNTRCREFPDEAIISDALKIAYREQGYPEYLQVYGRLRQKCFIGNK